jgi:hypothetical protein
MRSFVLLAFALGCSGSKGLDTAPSSPYCDYPAGAVEPMALGEVIAPYSWPVALHRDGREAGLELAQVPCGDSGEIDWSPFDVLLFVSIPAW